MITIISNAIDEELAPKDRKSEMELALDHLVERGWRASLPLVQNRQIDGLVVTEAKLSFYRPRFRQVRKISIIRKNLAEHGFKYDMKPRDRWSDYTYFKDGQIDGIHIKMFAVNPLTGGFVGQTETMNDFQNENPRFSSVYFSSRQSLLDEQEWYKKLLNAVYISNEEAEKGGTEK